jgi:hypothetical protein
MPENTVKSTVPVPLPAPVPAPAPVLVKSPVPAKFEAVLMPEKPVYIVPKSPR